MQCCITVLLDFMHYVFYFNFIFMVENVLFESSKLFKGHKIPARCLFVYLVLFKCVLIFLFD